MAQWKRIRLGNIWLQVWSLASLSGLRTRHCHEQWYRSQTCLGSCIAVAVAKAGSCSSSSAASLWTSICRKCTTKKQKKKEYLQLSENVVKILFPFCTTREAIISYIPQLKQQIATDWMQMQIWDYTFLLRQTFANMLKQCYSSHCVFLENIVCFI